MSSENTDFRQEVLDLESPFDVKLVRKFLSELEFDFKPEEVDYSMIIYNLNDQIIGTGSFSGEILKFVAVAPKFRESTAFAQIVTHLMDVVLLKYKHVFVYTKPKNIINFEGLGFNLIETAKPLYSVLEFGFDTVSTYQNYLKGLKIDTKTDKVASIVVNCNPFTNGHKYLIETAAAVNEIVYLFIVEEDKSAFGFDIRWNLVKAGISHLNNVVMVKGGRYIVSSGIFPSYFLKKESLDEVAKKQTELDIKIFAKYFVPVLGITKRYVGTENYCNTTAAYNETMKEILPKAGVEVVEVTRKCIGVISGEPNFISASKVRKAIKEDNIDSVLEFIPDCTKEFLLSSESNKIKENIKASAGRH